MKQYLLLISFELTLEKNEFILEESESEVQDKYKKIQINDELQVKIIGSKYTRKNYSRMFNFSAKIQIFRYF